MGGPQVNALQLLTADRADIVMSYDIQVLKAVENKLPVLTIASTFQSDLQGLMTHPDIDGLADLKGRKIFIASSSRSTFWPWLQQRYDFGDDQAAPYTFNLQPFLADTSSAVQGYGTSEPFEARQMRHVLVAGRLVVENGAIPGLDLAELGVRARAVVRRLAD